MYRKADIKELYFTELKTLAAFMMDNQDKYEGKPTVYYTTNDSIGVGFKYIATYDKPKQIGMYGKIDFGNCIDITDYEARINEI